MLSLQEKVICAGTVLKTIVRNIRKIKLDPEVEFLPKLISESAVCLDIGAAYGRYTLSLSKACGPSGRVYCFEPAEHSYGALAAIVKFYRLRNVVLVKSALSNSIGTGTLALPIKKRSKMFSALGHSLAHLEADSDTNYVSRPVTITTIDHFAHEANFVRLDFIKCDVEGAELSVFEGGRSTIERFKPTILAEIYKAWLARYHTQVNQIKDFFGRLGYQAFRLNGRELLQVGSIDQDGNYFFIPATRPRSWQSSHPI